MDIRLTQTSILRQTNAVSYTVMDKGRENFNAIYSMLYYKQIFQNQILGAKKNLCEGFSIKAVHYSITPRMKSAWQTC